MTVVDCTHQYTIEYARDPLNGEPTYCYWECVRCGNEADPDLSIDLTREYEQQRNA